ncbi:hypothetical protein EGK75_11360 [Neisseria weixii]|uniref:Uncharacterized protein n=1 Tax=Neisseria weixii TaxID=1853276 RepID=A0A3N4MKM8_9NEIS|nr:hypothetical protein EGK74_11075 [Neisseria weixii]RPD84810.1 hypothetical protein EGK75_11360 [Neisseria weixii]
MYQATLSACCRKCAVKMSTACWSATSVKAKPIGESAGTLVLSSDIACYAPMENPAAAPELKGKKGLALIPFYPLVHYRSEPFVEVCEKIMAAQQGRLDIRPITNHELFAVRSGVVEKWTVAKAV